MADFLKHTVAAATTTLCLISTQALAGPLGAVIGGFDVSGSPVGLEHDGSGNLWISNIASDTATIFDTAGLEQSLPIALPSSGNPIGITVVGSNILVTDTTDDDIDSYDAVTGNYLSSFSVSTFTTFPEGITYNPNSNSLFVVDGAGGNLVGEYSLAGSLLNTYSLLGSSQDGIAYDPLRDSFWVYDSGTDSVRHYDTAFQELENFAGTIAAGFASGEGLAVVGNSVFVTATGSDRIVEFDVSMAQGSGPASEVPAPASLLLIGAGILLMRRNLAK